MTTQDISKKNNTSVLSFYSPLFQYLLVGVITAILLLWQLGQTTLSEHEAKAALAARGMTQTNEWLVPGPVEQELPEDTTFNRWMVPMRNGQPRLVKTPLQYWLTAALAILRGDRQISEFSARVTAAVSGILCVWLTLFLGRRFFGQRAAMLAALMLATSIAMTKWGRSGRPDMLFCMFCTAAMCCFYAGLNSVKRYKKIIWMMGFWVALGLANLTKQFMPILLGFGLLVYLFWRQMDMDCEKQDKLPAANTRSAKKSLAIYCIVAAIGFALYILITSVENLAWWTPLGLEGSIGKGLTFAATILGPLVFYMIYTRGWKQIFPLLPTAIPGIVIMLALFVPWLWYTQNLFGSSDAVGHQVLSRATGEGGWIVDPPQRYLVAILTLTLPWFGFLPGALAAAWVEKFREKRRELTYLFIWIAAFVCILMLSAGKRGHYVLPVIPALCLLMGFIAEDLIFNNKWIKKGLSRFVLTCYAIIGPIAMAVILTGWSFAGKIPDWLPEGIAKLVSKVPAGAWPHLVTLSAIATGVSIVTLWTVIRGRFAIAFAEIAVAFFCVYVGFHTKANLWDSRYPVEKFSHKAAQIVGPDETVGSWGDPQAKVVYYFGRNIPNIHWPLRRMGLAMLEYPKAENTAVIAKEPQKWQEWLDDEKNAEAIELLTNPEKVAWLFSYSFYQPRLEKLGYKKIYSVQGKQRKKLVFTLFRNKASVNKNSDATDPVK